MPGGFDGAELRRRRLEDFAQVTLAALYENEQHQIGYIDLERHVAALMVKTGLTEPKVIEMLKLLNHAGKFELDEKEGKIKKLTI